MNTPDFWRNDLEAIERAALGVKRGRCGVLAKSQGGRDIYLVEYREKQDFKRQANYNSALYYRDLNAYANKTGAKPVVLIVGATHGGEIEGVTAVLNLIAALETGRDLRGIPHEWAADLSENYRLLIVPCLNPDGRARIPFEIVPDDPAETIYYKQGQWLDGTPADYWTGHRVHPIIDAVSHMGGYYNDAGVNPNADNYFLPMAPETAALLRLADVEAPDLTILLHTGCHKHGKLLQPYYTPGFINRCVMELDDRLCRAFEEDGYTYYSLREHGPVSMDDETIFPPPRLSMETAIHLICGGLSVLYESTQASRDPDHRFSLDHMLNCHFILFRQAYLYAKEFQQRLLTAQKEPKGML